MSTTGSCDQDQINLQGDKARARVARWGSVPDRQGGGKSTKPSTLPITASWLSSAPRNKEGFTPSFQGLGFQHGSFIKGF